ncbi:MAG TPA: helix-turn-helix domain-containing protein [Ktedonobacterales bacterium]|nr:helix-turn-helix domain-containing protein [Ktedonobacterales bacterium]
MPTNDTDDTPNTTPYEPESDAEANDLPETYELETLEQLRAIADELRSRIAEALSHRPMTVTQVGEMLGQAPAKIHYHVRELERVGLVRLVATREKSGILEKYYRAVARGFTASKTLLRTVPSDEALAAMRAYLDNALQGFLRATEYTVRNQLWENPKVWGFNSTQIWVTTDEMKELAKRVQAELDRYSAPRGVEGEEERSFIMMGYDPRIADESRVEPEAPPPAQAFSRQPPDMPDMPPPPKKPQPPRKVQGRTRARHVVVVGAYAFNRAYLEEAIAENRRLDISVIGICTVADDVTPDLVEQAISHFRHRGVLNASPAVREALKRKE